ncbi:cysteine desulfurase DndA [Candidatus Rariloculus sp.]|uniref:cysteine desulfurase DndA n=1 Tax=Candidatus Rariloculus sp. TaxID=3101265 RepID=UPI003D12C5EF
MKHTFASPSIQKLGPVYLDCNATAPMEPAVRDALVRWLTEEIGNAGSRTHEYGLRAKRAIQVARERVAAVVDAKVDEVLFTSGATESNNIAILGLAPYGKDAGRRHIVSTAIEHKAVLEPLEELERRGFEVTLVKPDPSGAVNAAVIRDTLRPDTLLVSVMHANNETGVLQPITEIAELLADHDAYLHVDAAQGYGKELASLRLKRIDLISVSSHKIYGPVGIGALIARRRSFKKPPLVPLAFGGGQERGLRPGTLPAPLIIGFGVAAKRALADHRTRQDRCYEIRRDALAALAPLTVRFHGDSDRVLAHVINFSIPGVDSEAVIIALKTVAAVSNGSACTSQRYSPSHVLEAMDLPNEAITGAVRLSWCHMTPEVDWHKISQLAASLT